MFERTVRRVVEAGKAHKWLRPLGLMVLLALFAGAALLRGIAGLAARARKAVGHVITARRQDYIEQRTCRKESGGETTVSAPRRPTRRALAGTLAACLLATLLPVSALAEEGAYPCGHVHDGDCGYMEAVEDAPCTHRCAVCAPATCFCDPQVTETGAHTDPDYPVYVAPDGIDALCAAIDALPKADELYEDAPGDAEPEFTAWETETGAKLAEISALWEQLSDLSEDTGAMERITGGRAEKLAALNNLAERLGEMEPKADAPIPTVEGNQIYANGVEIKIVAAATEGYTNILYDKDNDGAIGDTEYLKIGSVDPTAAGYDLLSYDVYGGSRSADVDGATKISMTGGKINLLCGGGRAVSGNADVKGTELILSGGLVNNYVYGGGEAVSSGRTASVTGDTSVTLSGDVVVNILVFGGGQASDGNTTATVTGNAAVTMTDGKVGQSDAGGSGIHGGGNGNNGGISMVRSASVRMTGGTAAAVYGGGWAGNSAQDKVTGTVSVSLSGDAEVSGGVYGGGYIYGSGTSTADSKTVAVGGGVKIGGSTGKGIVISDGTGSAVNGVNCFTIDSSLTENAGVNVQLPAGYDASAAPIIANGAVAGDLAKIKLVGGGAAGKEAYFEGNAVKVRAKAVAAGGVIQSDTAPETVAGYFGGAATVEGNVITLTSSAKLTGPLTFESGSWILDLKEHDLNASAAHQIKALVVTGGELLIGGTGGVTGSDLGSTMNADDYGQAVRISGGKLTVEDHVSLAGGKGSYIGTDAIRAQNATVVIKGNASLTGGAGPVLGNGFGLLADNCTVTISGNPAVTGSADQHGVFLEKGSITLSDAPTIQGGAGNFDSSIGLYVTDGATAAIFGGTFTGDDNGLCVQGSASSVTLSGGSYQGGRKAIAIESNTELTVAPFLGRDCNYFIGDRLVEASQIENKKSIGAAGEIVTVKPVTGYTVTFDANGGTVTPVTAETGADGKIASLPTPIHSGGYRFDYWQRSDGTRVTLDTVFAEDTTITARWIYTGGSSSSGSSHTATEKRPDGSTTTTVTKPNGTKTETTKTPDGTKVETVTTAQGDRTYTEQRPDGTKISADAPKSGKTTARVTLPERAGKTMISFPATDGTVVLRVLPDGTEEPVPFSLVAGGKVYVRLDGNAELKVETRTGLFDDMNGHWAEESADFTGARELFEGTAPRNFAPEQPMTRAMLATVLYRMDGKPQVGAAAFDDVDAAAWYAPGVAWASENGIAAGDGGRFGGERAVTRQELAVMLWRYAKYDGLNVSAGGGGLSASDMDEAAEWAVPALEWLCGMGVFQGEKNGALDPTGAATRAEVAAMLERFVIAVVQ